MTRLIAWFSRHTAADDHIARAMKIVIVFVALFSTIGLLGNYVLFLSSYSDVEVFDHIVLLVAPFSVILVAPKYAVETRNIYLAANQVFAASYFVVLANTLHAGTIAATVTYFLLALAICYALMFGWRGFLIAAIVSALHLTVFAVLGDLLRFDFTLAHRHGQIVTTGNVIGAIKNYSLVFLTASSCAAAFHQQMSRSVRDLAEARTAADAANAAKSEFLANMSHDIRTPMSGVIGMLEILERGETAGARGAYAGTALRSARNLMSVLDDIIDLSQVEKRQLSLAAEPMRIASVVDDVVALFAALAHEKSLALSADVSPATPEWVLGDPRRLRQVLTNLVGNALKFTEAGEIRISVGYDAEKKVARFAVSDTGCGIAQDNIGKVFDQFYQADSSVTRKHGGSGLGLAICKQLVNLMGGHIGLASRPGAGSVFDFSIPAPISSPPPPAEPEAPSIAAGGPLRLLVAEDNPAMQQILRAILESAGHELTIVSNGADAVARASSETFDAILLDMMMPGMDGLTAAGRIRALGGRAAHLPIVAMTANALAGDRDRCLNAGMSDYLSKPIDVPELFAVLGRIRTSA